MNNESEKESDLTLVRSVVEQLGEHFDSIQVFVTRHEAGALHGTVNVHWGAGNYFTRSGQVREWIVKQDEQLRLDVRNSREDDDA